MGGCGFHHAGNLDIRCRVSFTRTRPGASLDSPTAGGEVKLGYGGERGSRRPRGA